MAQPDYTMSSMSGGHRKPKTNIYTLLLVLALALGSLFFLLEILSYDWPWYRPWLQTP